MIATPQQTSSTPTLTEFNPRVIPFQFEVIRDIRKRLDYDKGVHEILLSGAVGSAKSLLMAHLGVTHCLLNPGAILGLGRLSMPALKGTIFKTIQEHLPDELSVKTHINETSAIMIFPNGSIIRSFSWQDTKVKKVRSFAFSAFLLEELTENDDDEAYREIFKRCGRLTHVKEKFLCSATNPEAPSHWVHKRFMRTPSATRHVYYSRTADNPFLPESYVNQLKEDMTPKEALRFLEGQWVDLETATIYYNYSHQRNFLETPWQVLRDRPICWSHDWNIGQNKPMSSILFQVDDDGVFHFFDEIVIEGVRTHDVCDELDARPHLFNGCHLVIMGDATGKNRDTRSNKTDFQIVEHWAQNNKRNMKVTLAVPTKNPPIRERHTLVNSHWLNDNGKIRAYIHSPCKRADEGMMMTKFKKGADLVEDDSFENQHITTSLGYGIFAFKNIFVATTQVSGMIPR